MNLILSGFMNGKTPEEEYVEFLANTEVELSDYAILDQTFMDGKVSNLHKHFYHLPELTLKKGESVRIYTGKGKNETRQYSQSKATVYFRFWGMGSCIWNNSKKDKLELIKFAYVLKKAI